VGQVNRKWSRVGSVLRGSIALGLLMAVAGPAAARPQAAPFGFWPEDGNASAQTVQQRGVSLQQAIAMAQQRYPGKVVRAETKQQNGRRVHEIRILGDDGRVRTVRYDADDRR
jgi:hypothetical protein